MKSVASMLGLVWLVLAPVWAQAQAGTLTLHYQERPPYSSTGAGGEVGGLVAMPAAAALRAVGQAFHWERTPSQRQLALIQSGQGLHCGVGWFRKPEREALGRFTQPLYQDRPFAALVRAESAIADGGSVSDLIGDTGVRLLVKEGYSYGATLDARLERAPMAPIRTAVDPRQMARMLVAGRADWMIVAPEEADALLLPGLRMVAFRDMPEGPTRHLYCSHDVPAELIRRIDQALARPR